MAIEQNTATELNYNSYLKLTNLLNLQCPLADPAAGCHDEMLFIVIHQVFELWFRLMIHEVDRVFALFEEGDTLESERMIRRLTSIVRLFIPNLSVLETMIPSDFIKFRDLLKPASGFQSFQFREIEFASGLKDPRYIAMFRSNAEATERLKKRFDEPSMWDRFVRLLERRGYNVYGEQAQIQTIVGIYRGGGEHDLRMLSEAMIEYDEMFSLWREHHVRMAQRMIGSKPGTGQKVAEQTFGKTGPLGTMGVEYLGSTLYKRFFPLLWAARTEM